MTRIIEAKAVISAEDRTGKVLDTIARKFKEAGKSAKVASEIARLGKEANAAQAGLKSVDNFRAVQASFGQARAAYRSTQQEVGRVAKELDNARKAAAQFDGVRSFSKGGAVAQEMAAARKQVSDLERQFIGAQRAVKASASTYEAQAAALKGAAAEIGGSGLAIGKLVAEENRLKAAVEGANGAIRRQEQLLKAESGLTAGMGAAGSRQHAKIAQDRYLTDGMSAPVRAARAQQAQERHEAILAQAERRQARNDALKGVAGIAGLTAVHKAEHFGGHALHTYQEFDNERRFGKAVMGLTDEEQKPLVDQAVHMGGSTRYNDVQVLEAQRELAARGLKKDQVMGLMEPAAALGQSLDLRLPDAVKQMEGAIFGFKKDISTLDAAKASAKRTADVQVKAAKISGMTPEDISQTYKYGATPARMAGLSEETLLAFAGISKKANMGGDEAGVAFRALVANAMSPTRGAKEAMLANGMDYKNYQKMPDKIDTAAFTKTVAATYGVQLDKATQGALNKIFTDKKMIADPSKFTPAVMRLLSDNLDGDDAKSKKSIAGLANRFRDKSMKGVDTDRLVADLMTAIPKNPALANAIFGSKQGARIANALGDPETFKHMLEELLHHADGYSDKVSGERNAGYDGAKRRLDGAITNVETKLGRAWDNDGNGGALTWITDKAGHLVQSFAELDNRVVQAASVVAAFGTAFVGIKSLGLLTSGFGLAPAAASLTASAAALDAAALRLGAGGAVGGAVGDAAKTAGAGAAGAGITAGGLVTGGVILGGAAAGAYLDAGISGATGSIGDLMRYREQMHADSEATKRLGYGSFNLMPPRAMLPGADGGADAKTTIEGSGGLIHDFLWGRRKDSYALPSFGASAKQMPGPPLPETQGPQQPGSVPLPPQRPLSLGGAPLPVEIVASSRGGDASGQGDALRNTLDKAASASATAANGGKPLEATVKPDQIVAKVSDLPPISGEATVTLQPQRVIVELNSDMLTAKIAGAVASQTAKMPLTSSGARPGAVSMPGAATTPGAQ